jgi:hypothetical protein
MVSCVQALLSPKMQYTVATTAQPAETLHKTFACALEYQKKISATFQGVRGLVRSLKVVKCNKRNRYRWKMLQISQIAVAPL